MRIHYNVLVMNSIEECRQVDVIDRYRKIYLDKIVVHNQVHRRRLYNPKHLFIFIQQSSLNVTKDSDKS